MTPLHPSDLAVRSSCCAAARATDAAARATAAGALVAAITGAALLSCSGVNLSKQAGGTSETAVARTPSTMTRPDYPVTKQVEQVDDYHGTKVADPYRWLESTDSPETKAWIAAENAVTRKWIDAIPARPRIEKRVNDLINYERRSVVARANGVLFFRRNPGLLGQDIFWMERPGEKPVVVLDPNSLSKDGTVAIGAFDPSEDARFVAYAVSDAGSDWHTWRVRDLSTMKDLPDLLLWSKFSGVAWLHDGSGFYYCKYPEPKKGDELEAANYFQKLYFHRLGDAQEKDELVYERPDQKEWFFGPRVTDDGCYLVLHVSQGTDRRNRIYWRDLQKPDSKIAPLLDDFDAGYDFLGNVGTTFYFKTDLDAPRGRILAVDLAKPARADWKEVVPTSADAMSGASLVHHQLVLTYLHDASSRVRLFRLDGTHDRDLELPGIGTAAGFGGKVTDSDCFWSYVSFVAPPAIHRYDFETGKSELWFTPKIDADFSRYETRLIFARSKDGTAVPIFVTARKGIALDGSHPCLLYGYGGFNISQTPGFGSSRIVWLEMGGVFAQAVLRGGGEYGETWHEAGMLANKQNVFDDFIAAAEHLIDAGFTRKEKLAIHGGSNGGLLVGACLTQRPDLFGAAVPAVGVLDMLRYHEFTIGWAWASEYGRSDHEDQFPFLYRYSPLHRLVAGTSYPPTLIITGDHDDRVLPAHSFKFAATLQKAQGGDAPVLIRIETRAGHGAGKSTQAIVEEQSDLFAFLAKTLRIEEGPGAP